MPIYKLNYLAYNLQHLGSLFGVLLILGLTTLTLATSLALHHLRNDRRVAPTTDPERQSPQDLKLQAPNVIFISTFNIAAAAAAAATRLFNVLINIIIINNNLTFAV